MKSFSLLISNNQSDSRFSITTGLRLPSLSQRANPTESLTLQTGELIIASFVSFHSIVICKLISSVVDFAKNCLLTGQEQACSRITRLFGCYCLSPCRKWLNTQKNNCLLRPNDQILTRPKQSFAQKYPGLVSFHDNARPQDLVGYVIQSFQKKALGLQLFLHELLMAFLQRF